MSSWRRGVLADEVSELEAGVSVNADDRPHGIGETGVLKTSAVSGGIFDGRENKAIWLRERARARVSPEADSILVSRMNTPALVGESAYVADAWPELFLPDRLWQLKMRDRERCCVRWVAHLLQSQRAKAYISLSATGTSGSMKNLPKSRFLSLPVDWPPPEEQRRIAQILDTLDETIRKTEQLIAKVKQVKQGLLHDLFSRGIDENGELRDPARHPEQFKDTPLGALPAAWTAGRLSEIGDVVTGRTPPSFDQSSWGDVLPFVTPVEVPGDGAVRPTERRLSASGLKYVRSLPARSILVVCIGSTIGKVGLTRWPCATNQQINAIVCGRSHHPGFMAAAVGVHVEQLHRVAGLQAVPIVNKTQFGRMFVPIAPLPEQAEISDRLTSVAARAEDEQGYAEKLHLLKQGLMEDLFTGRVRVTNLLDEAAA